MNINMHDLHSRNWIKSV